MFYTAFASKIGAMHNGTRRSCPKRGPTGRMKNVERTQPKTAECGRASARENVRRDVLCHSNICFSGKSRFTSMLNGLFNQSR